MRWSERRKAIEETYEKLLRELQKSKIDGTEFIRLRQQIEELRPLRDKKEVLNRDLVAQEATRRKLLSEWEDIKASEYRAIESAAKRVSGKLRDRVRVEVTMAGNRDPLETLLREVGGKSLRRSGAVAAHWSKSSVGSCSTLQRRKESTHALLRFAVRLCRTYCSGRRLIS